MELDDKTVLNENENISPKKKNNKGIMIGIIIAVVIVLAVGIGLGIYNSPTNRLSRQLDLGQKYLEEQNYEQAIVAFNEAIEIDPMSVEAYLGLADAYVALDDLESAISVLENGFELTLDESINQMLQELKQQLITGDFSVLGIADEYDGFGMANNGILIAGKGELWGAIDYDNNIIVPLEYTYGCQAANDEGQMWFGNETGDYVFDKNGQIIFETKNPIESISEGIILCSGIVDTDYVIEYVKLDGSVLYQKIIPDYDEYADIASAVGFSDGKAYCYIEDYSEGSKEFVELTDDGMVTDVIDKYYKVNESSGVADGIMLTTVSVNNCGWPIGAVNNGYFVSRIYDEVYVTSVTEDGWNDIGLGEFFYNNMTDNEYDSWGVMRYYKDGVWIYNKETLVGLCLYAGEEETYLLIDTWNENNIKLGEFDYLGLNDELYWLVSKNEQWGYTDHEGNVIALYEDAADFSNGRAIIIEDSTAYMIDESLNKLNSGCIAESVVCYGDIWALTIDGKKYFVNGMKE